jgi:exocyst complex component 1
VCWDHLQKFDTYQPYLENMHHFVAEMGQLQIGAAAVFLRRAESVYDENLGAYVKLVLRRPFAKIIVGVAPI